MLHRAVATDARLRTASRPRALTVSRPPVSISASRPTLLGNHQAYVCTREYKGSTRSLCRTRAEVASTHSLKCVLARQRMNATSPSQPCPNDVRGIVATQMPPCAAAPFVHREGSKPRSAIDWSFVAREVPSPSMRLRRVPCHTTSSRYRGAALPALSPDLDSEEPSCPPRITAE